MRSTGNAEDDRIAMAIEVELRSACCQFDVLRNNIIPYRCTGVLLLAPLVTLSNNPEDIAAGPYLETYHSQLSKLDYQSLDCPNARLSR